MTYFAHTATLPVGRPDPNDGHWQPLKHHLRNVGDLAKRFGEPLRLGAEAELAGLLHDLGKYRDEFQSYLRGERASSVETRHAIYGAAWALEPHQQLGTFLAIAGHHAGLHDLTDAKDAAVKALAALPELTRRIESELGPLPIPPGIPPHVADSLSADVYTRLLFSCVVDADRLDTAFWPTGLLWMVIRYTTYDLAVFGITFPSRVRGPGR